MLFVNTFPKTPSGKIELESTYLDEKYGQPLPGFRALESVYPLMLISPGSEHRTSSTFGSLRWSEAATIDMHPGDAAARGLESGACVRVWNDLGEVFLVLQVTDDVPPGVVSSLKGLWMRTTENGQTVSALAPATTADICEGACYNDTCVEVEAVPA